MKKMLLIIFSLICFSFIYYNSSLVSDVSNNISYKLTDWITVFISKTDVGRVFIESHTRIEINKIIRKAAHSFEFFVLTMVICNILNCFKLKFREVIIYTLFIVLFAAVCDEFIQIFVTDRGSSVADVLIDFMGSVVAVSIFSIFFILKRIISSNKGKHYSQERDSINF